MRAEGLRTMLAPVGWIGLGQWVFVLAAFGALVLGMWQVERQRRGKPVSRAAVGAVLVSAVWALLQAALTPGDPLALMADVARNLAWLLVVYALFARDGRHESVAPVRPVLVVLAVVELLQLALMVLDWRFRMVAPAVAMIFQISVMLRLLVITGALVLVHNLYAGAMTAQRAAVRWTCAALALIWGYDLNFYTIAYLVRGTPAELVALRALAALLGVVLLATGAARERATGRFSPSRAVAFQSLSLLVIGGYMLVMVGVAQSVAWAGGNATMLTQLGFVFATTVLVLALMPSGRLRSWLNVMVSKHFFQHRYDYRAEWLRFTNTIGRGGARVGADGGADAVPLHARVVQAVADITDSARGALLVPADGGELVLAARWQWATLDVPAQAMDAAGAAFFERGGFIVDLDEVRGGIDHQGEAAVTPAWMIAEESIWALVPLLHFDRLVGLVVLGRPAVARKLDWEDFDLLRVVGHQLASYIAESNGQLALLEASRFDEFNRRIAFVMHDIKNLASQLGLLARNAQRHADNPEFRKDMLVTLSNSADKLNALLARLSRYGAGNVEQLSPVDAGAVAQALAARWPQVAGHAHVALVEADPCVIMAHRETLDQVLAHLVQNAVDASPPARTVVMQVRSEGLHGCIDVIDTGSGMSAEFVRNGLFKPFVSTKPGGFGIGAFEARELVRAMRGRLDVESREGLGSRFSVRLPLASTAALSNPDSQQDIA
ncbi:XrtA/PEP-CTERM system histidine kinase PrsK [Novosphingobium sp. SG919]|uniref:XrtA/PEP-CTERM system histidine kinase PrsK n=1 Tax=unclassified Novosphingobium TaxID=2644732 RepID=UPI001818B910|nr:putative PEP-CTERM system histidine kinase [Novosphingobium sp. SG720]NMN03986.1 putative PEP-CTERM system histidine kinase [Novosphingobium sp. SG919]NMN86024.1 putative PEP-CTERM system histidine kinase [Novosphingobium sp. SG916]